VSGDEPAPTQATLGHPTSRFNEQLARKKIFVSNNTDKKNIVSDKCHKLSFYFLRV
jgi:hypothetical protein